jgi:hypothetical protein
MKREAPAWEAPGQRGVHQSSVTPLDITNGSPRVYAKTISEILLENRIVTKSSACGRYYTTCPQCSSKRKKAHQRLQCLGVSITFDGGSLAATIAAGRGEPGMDLLGLVT